MGIHHEIFSYLEYDMISISGISGSIPRFSDTPCVYYRSGTCCKDWRVWVAVFGLDIKSIVGTMECSIGIIIITMNSLRDTIVSLDREKIFWRLFSVFLVFYGRCDGSDQLVFLCSHKCETFFHCLIDILFYICYIRSFFIIHILT